MVGEQNGHYVGRVEKVQGNYVFFKLDAKIGKDGNKKGTIKLERDFFYLASGLNKEKKEEIVAGANYKINRKKIRQLMERRIQLRETSKQAITKGEGNYDDGMPDLSSFPTDDGITGTGIENILNQEDNVEIDDEDNEIKI